MPADKNFLFGVFLSRLFVWVCTYVGRTNPPTDLVCTPVTVGTPPTNYVPHIQASWNAPVPNGGEPRTYSVTVFLNDVIISATGNLDTTSFTYTGGINDGIYQLLIGTGQTGTYITCIVDSTDRCK